MKNPIDYLINFSVITEESLFQTYTLESYQNAPEQAVTAMPGELYVLQAPQDESIGNALVAERSGQDLLLSFRSQEPGSHAIKLDQFFSNHGALHLLKQDGELVRVISADAEPEQGVVTFAAEPASVAVQEMAAPVIDVLPKPMVQYAAPEASVEMAPFAAPTLAAAPLAQPMAFSANALQVTPKIDHAEDQVGSRTGSLGSGSVTDDQYATLVGTGTPGATLEVFDNDEYLGEVRVDANGNWSFDPIEELAESGHVFTVREQGSGAKSGPFVLIVDTIAPPSAVIDSISDNRGGNVIARDGHTADNTPFFAGTAEPLSMVAIYVGKTMMGTSFADASGKWTFDSIFVMPDGEYTITAKAMDFSGNTSLSSKAYKFTVDTIPPAMPSINEALDNVGDQQGALHSGQQTDDSTPTLTGYAEAGTTVFVYDHGKLVGTALANAQGTWSLTPAAPLADGEHSFTAVARDLAGNLSTPSTPFVLTLAPDATQVPTIDSVFDDVGRIVGPVAWGGHTDDDKPTLSGKGKPGDSVRIYDNGKLLGEAQVDAQGKWSFSPSASLEEGPHSFTVQAFNASQSPSALSPSFDLVLDLSPPDASKLSITSVYDDVGKITGNIAPNGRTDDQNPDVSGTGTAGNTVVLYVREASGQREVGRAQVDGQGKWSIHVADDLHLGKNTFTAVEMDQAGNATAPSAPYSITVGNDQMGGFDVTAGANSSQQINTNTTGDQNNPQVTRLANGNLVVVWQDARGGYDVCMQLMDPTGTHKIGQEQFVNQRNANDQDSPSVTALADGGFLITWESYVSTLDPSGDGVYARRYAADGAAQTDEFLVNQTTAGAQRAAYSLGLPDGGYIISWGSDQSGGSIVQRTYDANNKPVGNEVVIKSGGASIAYGGPEMVAFDDPAHAGWYLTVWDGPDGKGNGVLGQLRKTDGSANGPVITLNTTTDNNQQYPDAIALKDGSFVVFWDSNDSKAIGSDIRAAHYTFDPVTGAAKIIGDGDFIVNEYRQGKQYKPVGVALEDGGYVLIWGSDGGDGSGSAIFAQRFDANSQKIGHEFLVNPVIQGNQGAGWDDINLANMLDATLLDNGDIFVTWQSNNIDGSGFGIEGVTIDADAGFYSEFLVNTNRENDQNRSTTCATPDGGFVVVWNSKYAGISQPMGQVFDASGMPVGPEFNISAKLSDTTVAPDVVAFPDGTFMVSWHNWESGREVVHTQRFGYTHDDNGNINGSVKVGPDLAISPANYGFNQNSKIVVLDDGGYVVMWQAAVTLGKQWDIVARQFDASGKVVGGDTIIGEIGVREKPSSDVSVTKLEDGNLAIAWGKYPNANCDVVLTIYNPSTLSVSASVTANVVTANVQDSPSIATLSNGNIIVTWDSNDVSGVDQSEWGVWGRIFTPNGTAVGGEFLVNSYTPGTQKTPTVVANPNGGFIVLYTSNADVVDGLNSAGIYAQYFDNDGHRVGQELRIHQLMVGEQKQPDATFLADGRLFVTWTDTYVSDGSGEAIKGRIIDVDSSVGLSIEDASTPTPLAAHVESSSGLWMLFDDGSATGLMLNNEFLSSVQGGDGNDVIGISNTAFTSINGGAGIDTLLIDGRNMALDIDSLVNRITGIEKIDLGQGGANSVSLSAHALEGLGQVDMLLADGKNQFVINGDGSNSIQLIDSLSETWADAGQAEIGGVVYQTYVSGTHEVLIEQNIQVTVH
ncbi:hypothetical protein HNP46_005174 [Pseudomonas nitritireducens]|uniref:Bacterial Ig-like domain-containing protein n=1 Tax=Pseudomonas nitroreducens TaxID=46680 RepID=A0A7W7P3X9_PSENT|nr:Ig-like domain-containing protein [Pseudomonas nitritireducens]MBB4866269.1 hypothetical protein [Pseudomonas nitritireducens]